MSATCTTEPEAASEAPTTIKVGRRKFTILFPDLVRPLTPRERKALKDDIAQNGVVVPVIVDEDNGVIDGGNRVTIAAELGQDSVPVEVRRGLSPETKAALAIDLNAHRRHLTAADLRQMEAERAERIARVVARRQAGGSLRAIADEEGVSLAQVRRDIHESPVPPGTPAEPAPAVKGRDGKTYTRRAGSKGEPAGSDGAALEVKQPPAVAVEVSREQPRTDQPELFPAEVEPAPARAEPEPAPEPAPEPEPAHTTRLELPDLLGDLDAARGSPAWCLGMANRIAQLLRDLECGRRQLSACLDNFREAEGWRQLPTGTSGVRFLFYEDYCKAPPPYGLGIDPVALNATVCEPASLQPSVRSRPSW